MASSAPSRFPTANEIAAFFGEDTSFARFEAFSKCNSRCDAPRTTMMLTAPPVHLHLLPRVVDWNVCGVPTRPYLTWRTLTFWSPWARFDRYGWIHTVPARLTVVIPRGVS